MDPAYFNRKNDHREPPDAQPAASIASEAHSPRAKQLAET
jgi:hypothetical protein